MPSLMLGAEWGVFRDANIGNADLPQNDLDGKDYARYLPSTVKRLTDAPEAGGVTLPDDAIHAIIIFESNPVSVRIGSVDATATDGAPFPADFVMFLPNARATLESMSFIDKSGASTVHVIYGRHA